MPLRHLALSSLAFALVVGAALKADLLYHFTFEGIDPFANHGALGGLAEPVGGLEGQHPPFTLEIGGATGLGGKYAAFSSGEHGWSGGLITLSGSADKLRLDTAAGRLTISVWVRWEGSAPGGANEHGIINTMTSNNREGWSLKIEDGGKLGFQYAWPEENSRRVSTRAAIPAGQWVHVAATWDSGTDNALALYVNGVRLSLAHPGDWTGDGKLKASALPIALGTGNQDTSGTGGWAPLHGNLDDVALWDAVLTAAQIRALATAPAVLPGANAAVLHRLFDVFEKTDENITLNGIAWSYYAAIDSAGRQPGDLWKTDNNYYLWLDGSGSDAAGLIGVPAKK